MALNYITDYAYSGSVNVNHTFMMQISLRTLGGNTSGQSTTGLNSALAGTGCVDRRWAGDNRSHGTPPAPDMVTPGRYVTGLEFGQRVLIVKEANAAMAQMTGIFVQCRRLVFSAALIMLASAAVTGAAAQQIVVVVNGDPITALDIEQRAKLMQLSAQKSPGRQQVLEELINEKLKVKEAKRYRSRSTRQRSRPVVRRDGEPDAVDAGPTDPGVVESRHPRRTP